MYLSIYLTLSVSLPLSLTLSLSFSRSLPLIVSGINVYVILIRSMTYDLEWTWTFLWQELTWKKKWRNKNIHIVHISVKSDEELKNKRFQIGCRFGCVTFRCGVNQSRYIFRCKKTWIGLSTDHFVCPSLASLGAILGMKELRWEVGEGN